MNKKMYKKLQTAKLNHTDIFCITWLHSRSKVSFLSSIISTATYRTKDTEKLIRAHRTNPRNDTEWFDILCKIFDSGLLIYSRRYRQIRQKKKKKALYLTSFKLSALRWFCIDNKAQSRGPFVKYSQNVSYLVDYMVIILSFIYLTFLYHPFRDT